MSWVDEDAQTAVTSLLARACHELRTPVAVLGLAVASVRHVDDEHVERMMSHVEPQLARLRVTIDRYLDHAELQFASSPAAADEVDLAATVQETLQRLEPLVPAARVRRHLQQVTAVGDAPRVSSIVENLVLNAVNFAPGAPVDVRTRPMGTAAELVVRDQGMGIPEDELPHVARPFYRGLEASRVVEGAGLGLAIVAEHVARMDGHLHIDSRPGAGTRVQVVLPAAGQEPARAHAGS